MFVVAPPPPPPPRLTRFLKLELPRRHTTAIDRRTNTPLSRPGGTRSGAKSPNVRSEISESIEVEFAERCRANATRNVVSQTEVEKAISLTIPQVDMRWERSQEATQMMRKRDKIRKTSSGKEEEPGDTREAVLSANSMTTRTQATLGRKELESADFHREGGMLLGLVGRITSVTDVSWMSEGADPGQDLR
jgi:hypothetical protein